MTGEEKYDKLQNHRQLERHRETLSQHRELQVNHEDAKVSHEDHSLRDQRELGGVRDPRYVRMWLKGLL